MIFEPDEFTKLQDAVRQIYKKDFLSNQEMIAKYNQSLGIKEEAKRQFEEKKERDKSIGKVDVIELETGNKELKKAIRDSNRMNLNLFDDDISIKLALDRGELDEIYNTLKDLINGEVIKPSPNNNNIRYYKDQIDIIEDYFFKQDRRKRVDNDIPGIEMTDFRKKRNVREIRDMPKEDDLKKQPIVKPKKNKKTKKTSQSPRPPRPPSTPNPLKSLEDEKIIEQIKKSPVMQETAKFYEKLNDNDKLENYINEIEGLLEKNKSVKDEKENKKTYANLMNRRRAILTSLERLYQDELKKSEKGVVESKSEISKPKISGKGMKQGKSKKQGKTPQGKPLNTPVKKKSNKKSLGKQEQIYYLLSQRAGNNNKLMKKRLEKNKK